MEGLADADVPEVVEVRARWRYVLVPGSYVDPGLYEVDSATAPAMLFQEDLPEELYTTQSEGEGDISPVIFDSNEPIENRYGWTLESVREEEEKLDNLLEELEPAEYRYPSTSEADLAAAGKLLYWGFNSAQAKGILMEHRMRPKLRKRSDYLDRTILEAMERTDESISDVVDVGSWRPGNIFDEIVTGDPDE